MENYRKKLKRRCQFGGAYFIILNFLNLILINALPERPNPIGKGFVYGAIFGIMLVILFVQIRSAVLLRNEEKLKKQYIKDTDERNHAAEAAASQTAVKLTIAALWFAAVIASNFDMKVFITLLATMFIVCIIMILSKLFYQKTM